MLKMFELIEACSLSKAEFCYVTGCTKYTLRKLITANEVGLIKRGYTKYAKILMPLQVSYLLKQSGLKIDEDAMQNVLRGVVGQLSK